MNRIVERVWEYSKKNPDGFTFDLLKETAPRRGICVAYKETQNSHGRESLEKVIQHALEHDGIVGGWYDEDTGRYYFDSVRIFDEAKKREAFAFAIENEQLAVYVLSEQLTININK